VNANSPIRREGQDHRDWLLVVGQARIIAENPGLITGGNWPTTTPALDIRSAFGVSFLHPSPGTPSAKAMGDRFRGETWVGKNSHWHRSRSGWPIIALYLLAGCGMDPLGSTPIDSNSRARVSGRVYLLRGLMDVYSLGLNSLADELNEVGVNAVPTSGPLWP